MKPNSELIDDDNPKSIEDSFRKVVSFSALPESLQTTLRGLKGRGKQQLPTKVSTPVHFDREVLEAFRATGRGWQSRMNDALKAWLKQHSSG